MMRDTSFSAKAKNGPHEETKNTVNGDVRKDGTPESMANAGEDSKSRNEKADSTPSESVKSNGLTNDKAQQVKQDFEVDENKKNAANVDGRPVESVTEKATTVKEEVTEVVQ